MEGGGVFIDLNKTKQAQQDLREWEAPQRTKEHFRPAGSECCVIQWPSEQTGREFGCFAIVSCVNYRCSMIWSLDVGVAPLTVRGGALVDWWKAYNHVAERGTRKWGSLACWEIRQSFAGCTEDLQDCDCVTRISWGCDVWSWHNDVQLQQVREQLEK